MGVPSDFSDHLTGFLKFQGPYRQNGEIGLAENLRPTIHRQTHTAAIRQLHITIDNETDNQSQTSTSFNAGSTQLS